MDVMETIRAERVVAVVRAGTIPNPAELSKALGAGGISCVEFTFTTPGVLDAIEAAAHGSLVGAGTVTDAAQAEAAIAAGARFVVSPTLATEVVDPCRAAGIPAFLAAFTPTEVLSAVRAGAEAVKLFPARLGGPRYLSDLRAPFPDLSLIPSGGINEGNVYEYLEAGAVAVFAGSSLVPARVVETGDHDEIRRRAESFIAAVG
jgi:2-dehydro-3-deoxyphosphogluconate aldolase / (4S)-4-hydroxy-2-oxoglutarate aldolase